MEDKKFELSKELNKILEKACEYSRGLGHSFITVEDLMYNILIYYNDEKDINKLECLSLKRILNGYSFKDIEELLAFCKRSTLTTTRRLPDSSFKLPVSIYCESGLPLEPVLCSIVLTSHEILEKATQLAKKSGGGFFKRKLGTMEVFAGMLNPSEEIEFINDLSDRFNLDGRVFMGQILKDGTGDGTDGSEAVNSAMLLTDALDLTSGDSKLIVKRINLDDEDSFIGFLNEIKDEIKGESGNEDKPNEDEGNKEENKDEDSPVLSSSSGSISSRKRDPNSKTPTLDQFATDMTQNALDGKYDPVVGRDRELRELEQILSCRKKNNAILLGDPGCGKTAIVECLAQKIVAGEVPMELKGHRIMSLSSTDLLAGTMYRGQAEERVQKLCKELKENRDIILYMDEFHQATSENQTSISDMLKPSLGRGEVTMIASTTVTEYKKYVEKDGALKRRFQKVLVEEPNSEATFNILRSLAEKYEDFHHVKYSDEVLHACVDWSDKYIYDRKSPDKAIDLMDTAGANTKLERTADRDKIEALGREIEASVEKKIELVSKDLLHEAAELKDEIDRKREELEKMKSDFDSDKTRWPEVTMDCVARVVSDITNIPADKINNPEVAKLRGMKEALLGKVIGQDEGVQSASLSLSKSFLGLRDESRPIASLMFVGPTGVGKTLLCEEICETIYGDKKALLRIDCGEYSQPHTITKLLGAPASYVGYGEPGIFDAIRERPNSLVLFDEIEKMHPDIINTLFLNLMSTGMVKMSNGVEVSFRNCIIVFTGNVGTKEIQLNGNGIGFSTVTSEEKKKMNYDIVMKSIKKQFRPEFINRLTGITVFNELTKEDMNKIFDLELDKLRKRLEKRGYTISVTEELKQLIIDKTDTKYGARDLSRGISKFVEDRICETMLEKDTSGLYTIKVGLEGEESVAEFSK